MYNLEVRCGDARSRLASPDAAGPAGFAVRIPAALDRLLESFRYAVQLGVDRWEFAVEIRDLRDLGLTSSDLRWLLCKGYVEHATEVTLAEDNRRAFRRIGKLVLDDRTCFVLTEAGVRLSAEDCGQGDPAADTPAPIPLRPSVVVEGPISPVWNPDRQELRVGGSVVKQFRVPAPNQVIILSVFEEEGWPFRIDDPLAPVADLDPKRRLHDTINSLNRNQKRRAIRFLGDGRGEGICWEFIA